MIKSFPLDYLIPFFRMSAWPMSVNPANSRGLSTIQGSSTQRKLLIEEIKCRKRVKRSHANSAIMIPVADQFKLICQDGRRGASSRSLDVVRIHTSA